MFMLCFAYIDINSAFHLAIYLLISLLLMLIYDRHIYKLCFPFWQTKAIRNAISF